MELDKMNGNTAWQDALEKEIGQLFDYTTFEVLEKGERDPRGYDYIRHHIVFDVKYNLQRKARLVARGDMTTIEEENYS